MHTTHGSVRGRVTQGRFSSRVIQGSVRGRVTQGRFSSRIIQGRFRSRVFFLRAGLGVGYYYPGQV